MAARGDPVAARGDPVVDDILLTEPLAVIVLAMIANIVVPDTSGWFSFPIVPLREHLEAIAAYMTAQGYPVVLPAGGVAEAIKAVKMIVEVLCARVHGSPVSSGMGYHQDNWNFSTPVNTVIFYIYHTAKGGRLVFWPGDEDPARSGQLGEYLETAPPPGHMKAVLFGGDRGHLPENCGAQGEDEGSAIRMALVVQLPADLPADTTPADTTADTTATATAATTTGVAAATTAGVPAGVPAADAAQITQKRL